MVLKSRRTGARNWARGIFAFFWIVLAGFSSLYLFTLFTDPAALGGQTIQLSAIAGGTPAIPSGEGPLSAADTERLKDSLQALSKQMAAIDTRLQAAEDYVAPVAALPAPAAPQEEPAEEPAPESVLEPETPEPETVEVEETEIVEAVPEPSVPEPAAVPEPEPEPESPEPVAAAPEPPVVVAPPVVVDAPVVVDPPAAVAAPMAPEPEPDPSDASDTAAEASVPAEDVEIAAFDPVALPQTANDGSTRYGIEIGTVSKRNDLRPLWREYLTKHAALVAGLQPRRVLAPDKKWRLIAGPFANAQDAEGACSLFKKADRPCAATVYAGDAL
jgi:hypothetical protein